MVRATDVSSGAALAAAMDPAMELADAPAAAPAGADVETPPVADAAATANANPLAGQHRRCGRRRSACDHAWWPCGYWKYADGGRPVDRRPANEQRPELTERKSVISDQFGGRARGARLMVDN